MKRNGWYLVAYDITNQRRLSKIHRILKNEGLAVQKSLFFVQGTECYINQILDRLAFIMLLSEDDMRAYPIKNPDGIWTNGPNPLNKFPVLHYGTKEKNFKIKGKTNIKSRRKIKKSVWKRLLGI